MIFKRLISAMTGAALLTSYMSVLSGCSLKEFFNNSSSSTSESKADDGVLTNGEWLSMVNDAFGMQVDEEAEDGELDAARDWGVIGESEEIDKNAPVDDKFVTTTLMRAAGFADENSTDEEVINAAIEHGVLKDPNTPLTDPEAAAESLIKTQDEWANQEFEEHRNVDLAEGVQNFDEKLKTTDFEIKDDFIVLPTEYAQTLTKDSVFILPKDDETGKGGAYKVVATVDNGDGTTNVKGVAAKPEEVYSKLDISGKIAPDLSNFEPSSDPRVSFNGAEATGVSYAQPEDFTVRPLSYTGYKGDQPIKAMASVGLNSIDFSIDINDDLTLSASVHDISLNADIDWDFGIFSGLDIERVFMSIGYSNEISIESTLFDLEDITQKKFEHDPSIELGKIPVYICPGVSVNLRFELCFEASGKIKLSLTTNNTKGFEMKGSKFRAIDECSKSVDLLLTGEAGIYLNIILALSLDYCVGEIDLLSLELKFGPNAKAEAKVHKETGKDPLVCLDVGASFKVELKLYLMKTLMDIIGAEASITLIDYDKSLWNRHFENFQQVPKCTADEEATTEAVETTTIPVGSFELADTYVSLEVGQSGRIGVKSLPSGTSVNDLVWSSSDTSKVTVDQNGNIQA
ncbi:MAG: Ig-like domain-containing protein, partial [Ruminococcus sp.]|nr:Ig-like domain-containing protein [Ruminococcus sp.]